MDQIEFADGFDRPDTLAFGLGAGQLAVVMVGALAAYSLARSPLPAPIADPVAVLLAIASAGLGWLRIAFVRGVCGTAAAEAPSPHKLRALYGSLDTQSLTQHLY